MEHGTEMIVEERVTYPGRPDSGRLLMLCGRLIEPAHQALGPVNGWSESRESEPSELLVVQRATQMRGGEGSKLKPGSMQM